MYFYMHSFMQINLAFPFIAAFTFPFANVLLYVFVCSKKMQITSQRTAWKI